MGSTTPAHPVNADGRQAESPTGPVDDPFSASSPTSSPAVIAPADPATAAVASAATAPAASVFEPDAGLPLKRTHAGTWPPLITFIADALTERGMTVACSPDPSTRPEQMLILMRHPDGTLFKSALDRNPAFKGTPEETLTRLLKEVSPAGASLADLLGTYRSYWSGHHTAAAALTMWWDERIEQGFTVEAARTMLDLIACPEVARRVVLDEFEGRTRAWLYPSRLRDAAQDADSQGLSGT